MVHTPAQTRDKMVVYINGRDQKQELELNYQLCSYVHYTTKENLFGPAEEDTNSLNKIFNLVKTNFPNSLCEISTKTKMVGEAQVSQLENFVFSSENMKNLYTLFDDVVLIDSTYRTNKFNMPLLVLAGVNEESKTFMFGFALLSSEKEENVKWALEKLFTFLQKKTSDHLF